MTAMGGGGGIRGYLGYAGLVLFALVLLNLLVRRLGGWRKLLGWIARQLRGTVAAFTEPIAARRRYRRRLRMLVQVLRDSRGWDQAESAMIAAAGISPGMAPYAVALAKRRIGVLLAGASDLEPPAPWSADPQDPRLWWIDRAALPENGSVREMPLLVCVGTDSTGGYVIMLDLLSGPRTLSVYGVDRTARAVVQAMAAQLDVRLPVGAIEVAEGIHSRHDGMPLEEAARRLGAWFVVGAGPLAGPLQAGRRMLTLGVARGSSRLLEALPDQTLRLHGGATWLRVDPLPLAKAVARSIRRLPPHEFESGVPFSPEAAPADELSDLDVPAGSVGVSAVPDGKAASWS
ncbi:hypothetical protein JOF29_005314 [Kribbella aluminosa]|uniref:Uncharacterized protein n=1 Tax=Kribbella aluminosa TaxID=416017 RepID=A0ABS4URL3_9ACTN|nr:hypothetical protein [Kribbella aluminosa]MBP2354204.1 hypothetical protein [Kribbella aluminosa]